MERKAASAIATATFGIVVLVYLALHGGIRLTMWPTLGIDDAEQALFAQKWSLGYSYVQPPLFTWLLVALGKWIGVGIVAITILRYVIVGLTYYWLWGAARRCIADPVLAVLATFSLSLVYIFAYYIHHDLTHSAALGAAVAASLWAFCRLVERPTLQSYLLLGLVFGLGTLTKWNFVMLALAIPLTALLFPAYRPLVLTWRTLAAIAVAGIIAGPSVVWVVTQVPSVADVSSSVLAPDKPSFGGTVLTGTLDLVQSLAAFPQPFLAVFVACFGLLLWRNRKTLDEPDDLGRFMGLLVVVQIVLHWFLVPLLGTTSFPERWMMTTLMPLPLYLFALVGGAHPTSLHLRAYASILILVAVVALGARVTTHWLGADYCGKCRSLVPFTDLAEQLRHHGFAQGTILADTYSTGGNMRVQFPDSRVIEPDFPLSVWPAAAGEHQCLLVWEDRPDQQAEPPQVIAHFLRRDLAGDPAGPARTGTVDALMKGSEKKRYVLHYRLFDAAMGDCR